MGELGTGHNVHYSDIDLAIPQKKERAIVITGKDAGKTGTVTVR